MNCIYKSKPVLRTDRQIHGRTDEQTDGRTDERVPKLSKLLKNVSAIMNEILFLEMTSAYTPASTKRVSLMIIILSFQVKHTISVTG